MNGAATPPRRQGFGSKRLFVLSWRLGGLAAFLLGLTGCERGALMHWLSSMGVGGDHESPTSPGSLRLHEVDCPAGLTRCVGGVIEVSEASRHPDPCKGSPESCLCPWTAAGRCDGSCVVNDLALPFTVAQARAQLCATGATDPAVALPPPLGAAPAARCDERYRCTGSNIIDCNLSRVVATCTRGCVEEAITLDEEGVDDRTAVQLLCSR
jgi:hypothetical protein